MSGERKYNDKTGIIFLIALIGAVFFTDIYIELSKVNPAAGPENITAVSYSDSIYDYHILQDDDKHDQSAFAVFILADDYDAAVSSVLKLSLLFYLFASFSFFCFKITRTDPGGKEVFSAYISFVNTCRIRIATPRAPPEFI
jgi:hypothetical protein